MAQHGLTEKWFHSLLGRLCSSHQWPDWGHTKKILCLATVRWPHLYELQWWQPRKKKECYSTEKHFRHLGFKCESNMWDSSKDCSSWSYFFFFEKSHILLQLQNYAVAEHGVSLAKQPVCQQPVRWAPARWSLVNGEGNTSLPHALASHALWKAMWCILWWCTWHSDTPFYGSCHTRATKQFTTANKWSLVSTSSMLLCLLILFWVLPFYLFYSVSCEAVVLRSQLIWKIFNWAGIGEHQVLRFQNKKVIEKLFLLQKEKNPLAS